MANPASRAYPAVETAAGPGGSNPAVTSAGPAAPAAHPAVDVLAITQNDDFLLELGKALAGRASVSPMDSGTAVAKALCSSRRAQVLAVDTRERRDVRAEVALALKEGPHAVVLLFATADTEQQVTAAVEGLTIHSVLPIPLDAPRTFKVLQGALAEAIAKKPAVRKAHSPGATWSPSSTANASPAPSSARPSPAGASARPSQGASVGQRQLATVKQEPVLRALLTLTKSRPWVSAACAFTALAVTAGWGWYLSDRARMARHVLARAPSGASADAEPRIAPSLVEGKVDALLERARLALRERRYTDPAHDNALVYYGSAAAADPTNEEARDGLQRVAVVLFARFEEAMKNARFDVATLSLDDLKVAAPQDARLPTLALRLASAQITTAIADSTLDRARILVQETQLSGLATAEQADKWRAEIGRHQEDLDKLRRLAGLVADRINEGKLTEPVDSARSYVRQLQSAAPNSAVTAQALHHLIDAYLRKAHDAGLATNNTEVDRWLQEARLGGANSGEIDAARRDWSRQRQEADAERFLGLIRDRLNEGKLTEPGQDSAAYYLLQLQNTDPMNPGIAPTRRELAMRLLERAMASANAAKNALADADLIQAKRYGVDPKEVSAVQQLAAARAMTPSTIHAPALAAAPLATAVPSGGGTSNTAVSTTAAGGTAAAAASEPRRIRYVEPIFPPEAAAQNVSGRVIVQFLVDLNGNPHDIRVVETNAPGVFDQAAINAVRRWQYQPTIVEGKRVEVFVQAPINFAARP